MKNSPAYSLIFAIVFMVAIMLISATAIQNTQEKVVYYRNIEASPQAKLAAESAAELATVEIKDFGPGFEVDTGTQNAFCDYAEGQENQGECQSYGRYHVFAEARKLEGGDRWIMPIPNTGTAVPHDSCPKLEGDDEEITDTLNIDHSCNWNKILANQSVTIPLYSTAADGSNVLPTLNAAFEDWELKMRTPCKNGSFDDDCEGGPRYMLDGDENDYENDDTVILWQLIATVEDGVTGEEYQVVLLPDDEFFPNPDRRNPNFNTEIYESLFNETANGNHVVLRAKAGLDPYQPLYDLSTGAVSFIPVGDTMLSLVLQLDVVLPLKEQGTQYDTVPYLEWQFTSNGTNPDRFADTKSVIVGEGYYESGEDSFYYPVTAIRQHFSETFGNYVIGN